MSRLITQKAPPARSNIICDDQILASIGRVDRLEHSTAWATVSNWLERQIEMNSSIFSTNNFSQPVTRILSVCSPHVYNFVRNCPFLFEIAFEPACLDENYKLTSQPEMITILTYAESEKSSGNLLEFIPDKPTDPVLTLMLFMLVGQSKLDDLFVE